MELSESTKGILMLAARDSIQSLFGEKQPPVIDLNIDPELMKTGRGAFVTITIKNQLRGCVGYVTSDMTLFDTVCDAAIQAATNDPRFYPLTEEEVFRAEIEISVLSLLSELPNYNEIQIGAHGLVILDEASLQGGEYYKAVLLPQVATENHYDIPQFLTALCEKADLPPDTWRTEPLNIKTFTATVFSETGNRRKTYEQG
ncbi:MAG: AmmeMemoRadiSam system protein A [Ignavibacteriaceae bacterium]|nr:AmmeMemoRadiSam system protein A [Ignavibacteriaceae bacterium]